VRRHRPTVEPQDRQIEAPALGDARLVLLAQGPEQRIRIEPLVVADIAAAIEAEDREPLQRARCDGELVRAWRVAVELEEATGRGLVEESQIVGQSDARDLGDLAGGRLPRERVDLPEECILRLLLLLLL
jgi:hypothetical protein